MNCSPCNNLSTIAFDVQTFLNPECSSCGDSQCYPASNVCYTGPNLACSGVETNDDLDTVFSKMDEKLCAASGNFSLYQTNGLPTWFGSAIDDEATFVNAVTQYIDHINNTFNTFVTSQGGQNTTITDYIDSVNSPAIVCASAGVIDTDVITQILSKYCSKFGDIDEALDTSDLDFDTCFTVVTPPTTIKQALVLLSDQICQVKAIAEGAGGSTLPVFNNIGSCLPGTLTSTDTLVDTINKLKTGLCTLPTWDKSHLTWGCVGSPSGTLESGIQKILDKVNYLLPKATTFGSGFSVSPVDVSNPCLGVNVEIVGGADKFVAATSTDTDPGTLQDKLEEGDGINLDYTDPEKVNISTDRKLLASSTDNIPGFLINKLTGSSASGITLTPVYNSITKRVDLVLSVDPSTICTLVSDCSSSVPCAGYTVTPITTSLLSYTDCDGNVINVSSLGGPIDICAKFGSVYAPGATIVVNGGCAPVDGEIFSLINYSTNITVSDVLTSGLRFYTMASGSYPLGPNAFISGTGNTDGAVSILVSSGSGFASLFKNDILQEVILISGAGTYSFSAVTYNTGDDLKIVLNQSNVFAVENLSTIVTVEDIYDTDGTFFILNGGAGPLPIAPVNVSSGVGFTSKAVSVEVSYIGTSNRWLSLIKNSVIIQTLTMAGTGTYTFSPYTFSAADVMTINTSDTDPAV